MNPLALLVMATAVLVWVGQWISVRAGASVSAAALSPRLGARLTWWGSHRAMVTAACVTCAAGGLTGGLLAG